MLLPDRHSAIVRPAQDCFPRRDCLDRRRPDEPKRDGVPAYRRFSNKTDTTFEASRFASLEIWPASKANRQFRCPISTPKLRELVKEWRRFGRMLLLLRRPIHVRLLVC